MSIQSEINRIAGAKSDIADAIEDMGGTLSPGASIDDLAAGVRTIPQGSGGTTDANDVTYDSSETYDLGTVGAALNEQRNTLNSEIATRQTYVRPNLLDNWYFVGGGSQLGDGVFPINQRGQTTYIGGIYGIDRWEGYQAAATTNVTTNGLSIHRSSGDFYSIYQKVANPKNLRGKKVTATLLATGYNRVRLLADNVNIADTGDGLPSNPIRSIEATIPNDVEKLWFVLYTTNTVDTLATAAKLELGSGQTLAHNEGTEANPVWVLNEIPDYGEELRKCQRYYQLFRTGTLRPTYGEDCRPTMATEQPTKGTLTKGGVTYYTLSSEA